MSRRALYVETVIRTDLDTLWAHTQDPELHRRWDLRFGEIETSGPGQFAYRTRVLGLSIGGTGTHAGERRRPDGTRTSALKFGSQDSRSLIRSGAGYWRYTPERGGVRFVAGFDYETRWGPAGRLADRAFRPLFGWATAWSFDRLRIWLETGTPPERQAWLAPSADRCRRAPARRRDGVAPSLLSTLERP